jgi:ABC-type glycerol-3-phosphate transport system substrate-binding protein
MQVLFYRKDLFDKHKIAVPQTYDDVIAASKKLMEAKEVEYGIAMVYEKGGSVATEFSNALRANGGDWFDGDKPVFNGEKGVQAINKMKELMTVMPPDVLTFSNDKAMIAIQQGQVAMAHLYVTRAARMDDPKQSKFPNVVQYAVSPSFTAGGTPGTTWFRDMYVIPKTTKANADLIFRSILEATKQERQMAGSTLAMVSRASVVDDPAVKANPINRYMPTVLASLKAGAKGNPQRPYFGLASTAVGDVIHDALTGAMTPTDALAKATEEFLTQAKDKGFLK